MDQAWLDSLSEDWVSQPRSDDAPIPPPAASKQCENERPSNKRIAGSRIPRPMGGVASSAPGTNDNSVNVLCERSLNEINIPSVKHGRTKLCRQVSTSDRGQHGSRSVSAATSGSVVHNTVQHKSTASSPLKAKGHTPEWKRRLVYGDVGYGEQRDLFCSAAVGLEGMFKPPPPPPDRKEQEDPFYEEDTGRHETTLPSSPPLFRPPPPPRVGDSPKEDGYTPDSQYEASPSPSPRKGAREVHYRMTEDSRDASSTGGFSIHQDDPSHEGCTDESRQLVDNSGAGLAPPNDDFESRKASGQSVIRNEDFSPIIISKHSDEDGRVEFAPMEVPADQLRQRLENLRVNQILLDSQADQSLGLESARPGDGSCSIEDTEDYARKGGFLNLRRGGRSAEGSFRYRMLSPPLGVDTSEMLPEESLQASTPKQFPTVRLDSIRRQENQQNRSPTIPRAPHPSPEKRLANPQPSGGSPLKLFGPYDTFTNQTLMRRISQFEEPMSGTPSRQSFGEEDGDGHLQSTNANGAEGNAPHQPAGAQPWSVSHFGGADLEGYEFDGDMSIESSLKEDLQRLSFEEVGQENVPPGWSDGTPDSSPHNAAPLLVRRRRQTTSKHTRVVSSSSTASHLAAPNMANYPQEMLATPKRDAGSDGKRPRTSPSKDPTPKRRRTLHRSDIAYGRDEDMALLDSVHATHEQMQSAMGRKRKDARPGDIQQLANPTVLAHRQILRPRTPTPSQRSSVQRERHPSDPPPSSSKLKRSPTRGAHPSSATQPSSAEADRKPSIKTQDFLDEAAQIMAMIRNQVRPPNGLASVEEPDAENAHPTPDGMEESFQESTKEPFSRPPSRDGAPVSHMPNRQEDPEILNRLKQYQEFSDMGDIISSSMRSMGLAKDAIRAAQEIERQIREGSQGRPHLADLDDGQDYSDPPNIRISHNPSFEDRQGQAAGTGTGTGTGAFPSHSSGGSTNRSVPTGSSRGSDSRKTIMPQSVSHLIPDQVGSMYLDRGRQVWVKKKEPAVTATTTATAAPPGRRPMNVLPSEESEDDPFASIPDLSVDMTLEMRNLQVATGKKEQAERAGNMPPGSSPLKTPSQGKGYVTLSPDAAFDGEMLSRARDELNKLESKSGNMPAPDKDDVEHEFGIGGGRDTQRTPSKRRNLTISFSSPIASIIQDYVPEDLDSMSEDGNAVDPRHHDSPKHMPSLSSSGRKTGPTSARKTPRGSLRQPSFAGVSFVPRPVSRIDEREEESAEHDRQVSIVGHNNTLEQVSFVVTAAGSRPGPDSNQDASVIIGQNVGNLSLSPLSEFTVNHGDQSFGLEVSYIIGERRLVSGDGSKKVMSLTIRDLVDRLTEVEPSEPYWGDLEALDLHEKRLSSLHMLDEFCGQLVSLDASNNMLAHLDGIPSTVRQLKANCNMLSELTSWDHLMNLQYVDVSSNDISSLSALKDLVHLRSVKADNNNLTSLSGLEQHDGLLSLRARNNQIEEIDFSGSKLVHLGELDLGGNQIRAVRNLDKVPSLAVLKLQRNKLQTFELSSKVHSLKYLDITANELETLDLAQMPKLRVLRADRNSLSSVTSFAAARQLDSVSLREQKGSEPLDLTSISSAYEVRKLFLSGNYMGVFEPKVDFLNLQLLELASCGLQRLPENMGQLMPNLRSLNLNYNAISDLGPLRFIPRMKKLLVAGNRLSDSTSVTQLLIDFPHLTKLDLRDNPITLGFYAPLQVLVPADGSSAADPFALPEGDPEKDEAFRGRLDVGTKLRRRLHWFVFVGCCAKLKTLDGLPVRRTEVLARDTMLDVLVGEGLLPPEMVPPGALPRVEGCVCGKKVDESSRWNAEDSFA